MRVNSLIYSTYLVFCLFSVFEQPSVCCVCVVVEGRERGESNPKFYIIRKRLSSASRRCPCRDIVPLYHSLTFPVIESHSRAAVSRKRSSQKRERSASTLHTHTHYAQLGHVQITIDPIVVLFFGAASRNITF